MAGWREADHRRNRELGVRIGMGSDAVDELPGGWRIERKWFVDDLSRQPGALPLVSLWGVLPDRPCPQRCAGPIAFCREESRPANPSAGNSNPHAETQSLDNYAVNRSLECSPLPFTYPSPITLAPMTRNHFPTFFASTALVLVSLATYAQQESNQKMKPEETEIWQPVPPVVTPGKTDLDPP